MLRTVCSVGWDSTIVSVCLGSCWPKATLPADSPAAALAEAQPLDDARAIQWLKTAPQAGRTVASDSRRRARTIMAHRRAARRIGLPAIRLPRRPSAPTTRIPPMHPAAPATDLPSVLIRRGGSRHLRLPSPTPQISPATRQDEGLGDAFGASGDEGDSSRRTARRWRSQTPTYQVPAPIQGSTVSGRGKPFTQPAGSALRVETDGPKAIAVGKKRSYRIRLVNQGTAAARQVVVTASLPASVQIISAQSRLGTVDEPTDPAGGRRVVWSMEQVSASSQQELAITLRRPRTSRSTCRSTGCTAPPRWPLGLRSSNRMLAMNIDGPVEMRFGETKVFKVKLSNPGNGPAENVSVNIAATGANSQPNPIGTLAAGESRTLELELTAKQAGTMQIRAVARGDGDLQAESAHEVRVRRAALAVQVSAPGLLYAGTTASYKIRVANQGDAVAEGVIMQIELPAGAKNGIGVDKKPIKLEQPRWRIGDLGPGAERVYSMQCDLTVSGQNQLVARSIQGTDDSSRIRHGTDDGRGDRRPETDRQ